jgi:hypothetical protein
MMKRILLAALVGLVVSGPAWGDMMDGNKLFPFCRDAEKDYYSNGFCDGYITGVYDALQGKGKGLNGVTFCPPNGVTIGQLSDIVKKWLVDNPQHRHFVADSLLVAALSEAFPCK